MSYSDLLQEEVTGPLGLRDTVVSLSPEQQSRIIQGHTGQHRPIPAWYLDAYAGAGAIRSTAGDLLTYLDDALLNPDFHRWSSLVGDRIVKSSNSVWETVATEWCKECLSETDRNQIVDGIKSALD